MLILTEGDTLAQSSCLASLDLKILKLMVDLVLRKFSDQRFKFIAGDPHEFALGKIGGESPMNAPEKVVRTLDKHISSLEKAADRTQRRMRR